MSGSYLWSGLITWVRVDQVCLLVEVAAGVLQRLHDEELSGQQRLEDVVFVETELLLVHERWHEGHGVSEDFVLGDEDRTLPGAFGVAGTFLPNLTYPKMYILLSG